MQAVDDRDGGSAPDFVEDSVCHGGSAGPEATLSLRSGNVASPGNWQPLTEHMNVPHHDVHKLHPP